MQPETRQASTRLDLTRNPAANVVEISFDEAPANFAVTVTASGAETVISRRPETGRIVFETLRNDQSRATVSTLPLVIRGHTLELVLAPGREDTTSVWANGLFMADLPFTGMQSVSVTSSSQHPVAMQAGTQSAT